MIWWGGHSPQQAPSHLISSNMHSYYLKASHEYINKHEMNLWGKNIQTFIYEILQNVSSICDTSFWCSKNTVLGKANPLNCICIHSIALSPLFLLLLAPLTLLSPPLPSLLLSFPFLPSPLLSPPLPSSRLVLSRLVSSPLLSISLLLYLLLIHSQGTQYILSLPSLFWGFIPS